MRVLNFVIMKTQVNFAEMVICYSKILDVLMVRLKVHVHLSEHKFISKHE